MLDWEYSDEDCPKCQSEMATRRCASCGGEGWIEEDEDDEWRCEDRCDNCNGKGHETWCRACGWDDTEKQFMSEQYEIEWLARQGTQEAACASPLSQQDGVKE